METHHLDVQQYVAAPATISFDYDSGLCFLDEHPPIVMDSNRSGWLVSLASVCALGYKPMPFISFFATGVYGEPNEKGIQQALDYLIRPELLVGSFDKIDFKERVPYQTYFVLNKTNRYIKIGRSKTPQARFKALQGASPDPLELLYVHAQDIERQLHKKHAAHRIGSEWFASHQDIYDEIRTLKASQDDSNN